MARLTASVVIEGDFIDSFVYSGALFLIDADSVLRTYPWKELISAALVRQYGSTAGYELSLLTAGGNFSVQSAERESRLDGNFISIDPHFLTGFERASTRFDCWPTDMDVYSNNLYITSENGASKQKFSWDGGNIQDFGDTTTLWDEMAFRISPTSMNRVAIAVGVAGVIAVRSNDRRDTTQIFDNPCGDCEWKDSTLIANTSDGAFVAEFENIPKYDKLLGSQAEYWKIVNAIKVKAPSSMKKIEISGREALASWTGGDRLFAIDHEFQLYASQQIDTEPHEGLPWKFEALENPSSGREKESGRFLSSRTGAFGTVVEFSDALFQFSEAGMEKISNHPVRWRVFPRARNFANHLHIIEEHGLCVRAFGSETGSSSFDRFGFALESIDEV